MAKQREEQSHAQCHITHRIRIFDQTSKQVHISKLVDFAVPKGAVTKCGFVTCTVFEVHLVNIFNIPFLLTLVESA